jgi:hypothetical protein
LQKRDKELVYIYIRDLISVYIYVPVSFSGIQIILDIEMNKTLWMLQAAAPILPMKCYEQLLSMICHAAFPTCREIVTDSNQTGMCYDCFPRVPQYLVK